MPFLDVVAGLRTQLGIDEVLPIQVAVRQMCELMGLRCLRGDGSCIPLPELVEALCESTGFSLALAGGAATPDAEHGIRSASNSDEEEEYKSAGASESASTSNEYKQRNSAHSSNAAVPRLLLTPLLHVLLRYCGFILRGRGAQDVRERPSRRIGTHRGATETCCGINWRIALHLWQDV